MRSEIVQMDTKTSQSPDCNAFLFKVKISVEGCQFENDKFAIVEAHSTILTHFQPGKVNFSLLIAKYRSIISPYRLLTQHYGFCTIWREIL